MSSLVRDIASEARRSSPWPTEASPTQQPREARVPAPRPGWSPAILLRAPQSDILGSRSQSPDPRGGDGMTLSLVSLLSRDITALWLVLKTSTGVPGSAV